MTYRLLKLLIKQISMLLRGVLQTMMAKYIYKKIKEHISLHISFCDFKLNSSNAQLGKFNFH